MTEKVFRIGPIRPPSESMSLLLQVTQGCTWNKCKFCDLYRNTKFKAFTIDSIKEDIDQMAAFAGRAKQSQRKDGTWDIDQINQQLATLSGAEQHCYYMVANWLINGGENVFLQDGNTLALSGGRLTEVLRYLKMTFPQIRRITSYGRAENLSRVSREEYAELKAAGLDRIHSGYESGSDAVLRRINKGVTAEQQITAGKNIKAGGLELSVYFMPGIGGKDLSEENAAGMARVIREVQPDFVRIRTAAVKPGTELYDDFQRGDFVLCSEDEKVREIRTLITDAKGANTRVVSDHIVNLLQGVKGSLNTDTEKMLNTIDQYLDLPEKERKTFQLVRRLGRAVSLKELQRLTDGDRNRLEQAIREVESEEAWNEKMNGLIGRYI